MEARLLCLGLGVEADDKGIFEWKPVTLKMRLFPADNIDIALRLAELVEAGVIMMYEIGGRKYGAIRKFRKHQRPKTPNNIHPITPEVGNYVGLESAISETGSDEPDPFPPNGEKSPQMEDVGWREGGRGEKPNGFSARETRKKPKGWVSPKTPMDAANNIIRRIRDNEQQRIGAGNDGADGALLQLPAVGRSGA
ncbi:hypothetical protein [Mesorhizobium ciceri]|uniref:hypothetical protein n=1 Tax=Mesorhizobium TaxID=68287 RepID=UPI0012DEA5F8|nr:hypothetical protein [Mesorhizobium ciceri]